MKICCITQRYTNTKPSFSKILFKDVIFISENETWSILSKIDAFSIDLDTSNIFTIDNNMS